MTSQPVSSIFLCSPLPYGTLRTPGSPFPDFVFQPLFPSALSSFPFHCGSRDGLAKADEVETKIRLMHSLVIALVLDACKSWTHSRAAKKNTSHENEVLPQDTTHLIQRPCYQQGSPCQNPAGSRTTRRPPDHCKETQTAMVWSSLPFIRSCQNHLARHSERGKKTRGTKEEVVR